MKIHLNIVVIVLFLAGIAHTARADARYVLLDTATVDSVFVSVSRQPPGLASHANAPAKKDTSRSGALAAGIAGITALLLVYAGIVTGQPLLALLAFATGVFSLIAGIRALKRIRSGKSPTRRKAWAWVGIIGGGVTVLVISWSAIIFVGFLSSWR